MINILKSWKFPCVTLHLSNVLSIITTLLQKLAKVTFSEPLDMTGSFNITLSTKSEIFQQKIYDISHIDQTLLTGS